MIKLPIEKVDRIYHLSDIHIRNVKRHKEYRSVFNRAYKEIRKNTENSVIFAKSILIGVPASYLFFIPFFFAKSLNMNFWIIYGIGLLLLIIGYFLHKYIINLI